MNEKIDLKEIERRAYTSYHEDGLLDILIGVMMMIHGIYVLAEMDIPFYIFIIIASTVWANSKKTITIPRIGYVKFREGRRSRQRKLITISLTATTFLITLGLIAFTQLSGGQRPLWLDGIAEYGMIIVGAALGLALFALGYFKDLDRFTAYGALTIVMNIAGSLILPSGWDFWQGIAAVNIPLGAVLFGYGGYMLYRFKRKYPLPMGDEVDVGE